MLMAWARSVEGAAKAVTAKAPMNCLLLSSIVSPFASASTDAILRSVDSPEGVAGLALRFSV